MLTTLNGHYQYFDRILWPDNWYKYSPLKEKLLVDYEINKTASKWDFYLSLLVFVLRSQCPLPSQKNCNFIKTSLESTMQNFLISSTTPRKVSTQKLTKLIMMIEDDTRILLQSFVSPGSFQVDQFILLNSRQKSSTLTL